MPNQSRYILFLTLLFVALSSLLVPNAAAQSTGVVAGRVVDAGDGTPLPGANVIVDGTSTGASTGAEGRFKIRAVPTGTRRLVVSYVSYQDTTVTVEVRGDRTATRTLELRSEVTEAGEVVVTGLRESQMRSVNQKRQAPNVVDALSADDIGNLPEKNVAEAVQRLPGIVMRNDRTEGRFVSIRGSAANLNNVTLNGNSMASTAGSRATALDLLPAEMVSNVEVTKAVTPDMPGNAIGGSVNISTLSAFDRDGSFLFGSVRGLTHEQQVSGLRDNKFPFRANLTGGTQFGTDDQFGVLISASGSRRDFTTSGLKAESWEYALEEGLPTTNVPEAQEQIVESNRRSRYALNGSFDWRPSARTSVYVRPYYTYTDEEKLDNEMEYALLGQPEELEAGAGFENGARFPEGFAEVDLSFTEEEESLWGTSAGFEHDFDNSIAWSASGTYSRGVLDGFSPDGEFALEEGTEKAAGVADMSNFLFDFFPENPKYIRDGSNYTANDIDLEYEENTENTYSAKTDVQVPFTLSEVPGYLKVGGQFSRRDKVVKGADIENIYEGDGSLTLGDYQAPRVQTVQVGNSLMPFANTDAFTSDFLNEICNPPSNRRFSGDRSCRNPDSPFVLNEEEVAQEDAENDSKNEESIYAGYAMASAEFGALTALAGVRLEHTSTSSTRFELVFDEGGEFETGSETFENAYTDVLPSVHLTFDASDNLKFRGAWSNTIGRPDYDDLASFSEVEINDTGNQLRASVNEGNPDLKPYRAMNFDLTAEYYIPNGGLASVAGFYKRIDNPIYEFESEERGVQDPFGDGRTFDRVQREQERNADLGTILGLEATYQQPFTFLPAPFDGLGLNSNLTVTDSEVDVPSREGDFPFFEQADLVYNAVPYFQKAGFETRVALNYRGDYLLDLGDTPVEDTYVKERTTVDVNASYEFNDVLAQPTLMVQIENVTNEPEVEYEGQEENLGYHFLSGRTVTIGFSAEF
ncbi:TonB-dependent receptor [Salinibacter altiplanensis]|uniref:TonB-dependent receptor n=1 Tax=Salinibacter altiplanensis TaxID=1803181 RepID=UPI000C9F6F69|nr:TonB-dependent receptor [Salinibacter altiplanensis]